MARPVTVQVFIMCIAIYGADADLHCWLNNHTTNSNEFLKLEKNNYISCVPVKMKQENTHFLPGYSYPMPLKIETAGYRTLHLIGPIYDAVTTYSVSAVNIFATKLKDQY